MFCTWRSQEQLCRQFGLCALGKLPRSNFLVDRIVELFRLLLRSSSYYDVLWKGIFLRSNVQFEHSKVL